MNDQNIFSELRNHSNDLNNKLKNNKISEIFFTCTTNSEEDLPKSFKNRIFNNNFNNN